MFIVFRFEYSECISWIIYTIIGNVFGYYFIIKKISEYNKKIEDINYKLDVIIDKLRADCV